jgi:ribulose kinase
LPAVFGVPVNISEIYQVSGLGAAICAAVGARAYTSLEEAMEAIRPKMRRLELDRLATLEYTEYYQTWAGVAQSMEKLNEDIK